MAKKKNAAEVVFIPEMEFEFLDILFLKCAESNGEKPDPEFSDRVKTLLSGLKKMEAAGEHGYSTIFTLLERTGALNDDLKRIAVLLMLAYERNLSYREIFSKLRGNDKLNFPTVDMVLKLYGLFNDDINKKDDAFLTGDGGLFYHIIRDITPGQSLDMTTVLRLRPGVVPFISGIAKLSAATFHFADFLFSDGKSDDNSKTLFRIMSDADLNDAGYTAVIYAPDGVRRGIKTAVSRAAGNAVIAIDLSKVSDITADTFEDGMADIVAFSALSDVPLFFINFNEKNNDSLRAFSLSLDIMKYVIPFCIVAGEGKNERTLFIDSDTYEFTPELPSIKEKKTLWKEALSSLKTGKDVDIENLALSYDLSKEEIDRVAKSVRSRLVVSGKKTAAREDIITEVLSGSGLDFGNLATRLPSAYSWDDIELSEENRALMKTICNRYRMSRLKEDDWGLRKKNAYGNGISVLFSGPSGTGKTMSAMCIAGELGLELYRVDLSQMSSKWIGETEKNIGKVFDEAEKSRCILFFDEADALFAKRTDVSTSNDKHANNETAYILQKMEEYDGVSLMATNLYQNFDTAFLRRITYTVKFTNPDKKLRESLWKKVLPKEVPIDPKLDLSVFADRFELSGANIKSIMYDAAYMAAAGDKPIDASCIVQAVKYEMRKLGRMVNASDFGAYAAFF